MTAAHADLSIITVHATFLLSEHLNTYSPADATSSLIRSLTSQIWQNSGKIKLDD